VIEGVGSAKAGDVLAAVSGCLACPLASVLSVGTLFYALLVAGLPCID
jgi:cytochrome c551/c552